MTLDNAARLARRLTTRKGRDAERSFLLEGTRLLSEALAAGARLRFVLFTREYGQTEAGAALLHRVAATGVVPAEAELRLLRELAGTEHSQGVLAAARFLGDGAEPSGFHQARLLLALDGVADPGNGGALLRVAAAAGVGGVAYLRGCVDVYNEKVVRAAAGAHFHVPFVREATWEQVGRWVEATSAMPTGRQVLVAQARSGVPYTRIDWRLPSLLVVGSEARGPAREAWRLASSAVHVPLAPGVESLNAAAAAAVILFEARRQATADEPPRG